MSFKPIQDRSPEQYERQILGLQRLLSLYAVQTHETFHCICGDWHCYDDQQVSVCALGPDYPRHCADANCGPCKDERARESRAEQAEDMRRGL